MPNGRGMSRRRWIGLAVAALAVAIASSRYLSWANSASSRQGHQLTANALVLLTWFGVLVLVIVVIRWRPPGGRAPLPDDRVGGVGPGPSSDQHPETGESEPVQSTARLVGCSAVIALVVAFVALTAILLIVAWGLSQM